MGEPIARDGDLFCPSARCEPGARLIGIVGPDSRVAFVTPALPVTEEAAAAAQAGRTPEKRFRFAQPSIEGGCRHWTGARCGVADAALELDADDGRLPRCGIRPDCRWFAQAGAAACRVCPYVITDVDGATAMQRTDDVAAANA